VYELRSSRATHWGMIMYKRILAPIDGSACSLHGLDEAISFAKQTGAALKIVHAVNEFFFDSGYGIPMYSREVVESLREAGEAILKSAASKARERGVQTETVLLDQVAARVADLILEQAKTWPADLIVMGTHGRRGLSRLAMGSDAEMVLRSATVPVLFVRAPAEK
jgi:nucleotide-binding universal stress UspA family protein